MALNKITNARPVEISHDSDQEKLAKLVEKQASIHHKMCDIFESHDLDIDDVREAFTTYGVEVHSLYVECRSALK